MKRAYWITALKTLVTAGALGYLVYVVHPQQLAETILLARPAWLVLAAALLPLNLLLEARTWQLFGRLALPPLSFAQALRSLLAGHALGFFTPARVGEFAGRILYLRAPDGWAVGAAIVAERTASKVIAVGAGVGALVFFVTARHPDPLVLWLAVLVYTIGSALLLTGALLFPRFFHRLLRRWLPPRWHDKIQYLALLRRKVVLRGLGLSALRYLVYVTQFVVLLRAFGPLHSAAAAYLGIALTYVVKFLLPPITLLDLGIREGAAVFFLGAFGFAAASALNASLFMFSVNVVLPALLGLPGAFRLRLRDGSRPVSSEAPAQR